MIETLANGYSSESTQRELSNEYQHDRIKMISKEILNSYALEESSLSIERDTNESVGVPTVPLIAAMQVPVSPGVTGVRDPVLIVSLRRAGEATCSPILRDGARTGGKHPPVILTRN